MRPRMRYDIGDNNTWEWIGVELFVQVAWLYSQLVLGWYCILKKPTISVGLKSWWNQCFLLMNFCHLKNTLKTESSVTNSLFSFKCQKTSQSPTIWKVAEDFLLSYFEYCQIWLNILLDDCQLGSQNWGRKRIGGIATS